MVKSTEYRRRIARPLMYKPLKLLSCPDTKQRQDKTGSLTHAKVTSKHVRPFNPT